MDTSTYDRLITLLEGEGASFRVIDHAAEGRTDIVSAARGHPPSQAAKCIIIMTKLGKRTTRYLLAVVPGDARVDFSAIRALTGATYVAFASPDIAERLAGSVSGTVLPFAFSDALELIADPAITKIPELYFNAARLDRSLALSTADYLRIARPRIAPIAERSE
jgi:Ala-tRNA(Pro) deacylase